METSDISPVDPRTAQSRLWRGKALAPIALLVVLSLPDLFSPPGSPTILRQTQTYSQIVNFVESGFSLHGLAVDLDGPTPVGTAHEFPLYQTVVGLLFKLSGPSFFAGKLVSLAAMAAGFAIALRLVRRQWGGAVATRAGFFFAACPITLLLSAAFQPDAMALAFGALAAAAFVRWKDEPRFTRWLVFLVALLAAALAKFTVLVPFVPVAIGATLFHRGVFRMPALREVTAVAVVFLAPFVAWNVYRTTITDPRWLAVESAMFLVGDLTRFLQPGYYVKPAFILCAMVLCGAGVPLVLLGARRMTSAVWLLVAGLPFYYVLIPTAAEQTYYALPVVPVLALLAARGALWLENRFPNARRLSLRAIVLLWAGGFAVAAPYTLRHDNVSLAAAHAAASVSREGDLLLVANMHDRGVGIGGFNSTIVTLAGRRGWNIASSEPTAERLREQIRERRGDGARWIVITWFTPDLDPWFSGLLPASFSRVPRFHGEPVDGEAIADALASGHPVAARGPNFAVLELRAE